MLKSLRNRVGKQAIGTGLPDRDRIQRAQIGTGNHLFEDVDPRVVGRGIVHLVHIATVGFNHAAGLGVDDLAIVRVKARVLGDVGITLNITGIGACTEDETDIAGKFAVLVANSRQQRRHGVIKQDDVFFRSQSHARDRTVEIFTDQLTGNLGSLDLFGKPDETAVFIGQYLNRIGKTEANSVRCGNNTAKELGHRFKKLAPT